MNHLKLLLSVVFVFAGCASNSQFVRVQNPFIAEKKLVDNLIGGPVDEKDRAPWERPGYYEPAGNRVAPPEPAEAPQEKKGLFRGSKPARGAGESADVEVAMVEEAPPSGAIVGQRAGGKFCNDCRGMGFQIVREGQRAESVTCPQCHGMGRVFPD